MPGVQVTRLPSSFAFIASDKGYQLQLLLSAGYKILLARNGYVSENNIYVL